MNVNILSKKPYINKQRSHNIIPCKPAVVAKVKALLTTVHTQGRIKNYVLS